MGREHGRSAQPARVLEARVGELDSRGRLEEEVTGSACRLMWSLGRGADKNTVHVLSAW